LSTVITVENIGKKYILSHRRPERYIALRDVITNKLRSFGKKVLRPVSYQPRAFNSSKEEFWALKDVSFEIKQGDRVGIIGRNGAGKTTLLKLVSRITEPTTGRITLKGRVASLLEVGTGFHPELTGRENIFLNGAILGMSKAEIKRKFDEIVDFAEVEKFLDTPVKRYSSGMYVRLAFAVAAHLEPEILIVDEVLAVGDAQFQKKCLGKMEDVSTKEGRTVLFVSHNMAMVNNLCPTCIHLASGIIHEHGPTASVIQHYLSPNDVAKIIVSHEDRPIFANDDLDVDVFYACDATHKQKNIFKTSENVYFYIKYNLKRELIGLRVGLDFLSLADGEVLFRSFDDDMSVQSRGTGYKEAICTIPSNLLMHGIYMAKLQIGVHNVRWIVNGSIVDRITIEYVDGVNKGYADNRPGRIMPNLHWTITE
jgi:lipopolysaccharide transport system ATP-binding protein